MMDIEQIIRKYIDKSLHMSLGTVSGGHEFISQDGIVVFTHDFFGGLAISED